MPDHHPLTSLPHSDIIDRSDTESLASDLSDDSGVSNDSTVSSSASTSANYRALDAYAADPSFKVRSFVMRKWDGGRRGKV